MTCDTDLLIGTEPQFAAILWRLDFSASASRGAGNFRLRMNFPRNHLHGAGGLFWKRMQNSLFEFKAFVRTRGIIGFLGLAMIFAGLGSGIPADALASDAVEAPAAAHSTTVKKLQADVNDSTLQLSLEQAMWTALAFEDTAKLRALLKRGADPNKPEKLSQMTPLMAAETAVIAEILLNAGADPNLRDRTGRTALHHAVKMREAGSVVRLLGQAGANVNARADDLGNCTPLLIAVEHYLEDKDRNETALAMRILVHLGADVDAADSGGRTPLALAAANNQPELIRLLIELGADPKRRMVNGRTPLDYAREANAQDAIQALAASPSKQPPAN